MTDETSFDPDLTRDDREAVSRLCADDLARIDGALLKAASAGWRKVAFVVGGAMLALDDACFDEIPDVYLAERVRELVAGGALQAQGDLRRMRSSEIRLPGRR